MFARPVPATPRTLRFSTAEDTMKNGRSYEAATLTEIWPRQKPLARLWWETSAVNAGAQ